ncbi:acyltransferase [Paracoccaceae bacterium]|nr:acyltransferase [Paracoccaceae bacterium]
MNYRSEIDGLRALAVIPVILFHAGFELFSGGFIGVDVFFVISGYLITTIIIDDLSNKRFSLVQFYERRARRILPALFFMLSICIPVAWILMTPNQMKDFSAGIFSVSLFLSNLYFMEQQVDYFAPSSELHPLLHTWSLAVEEQFYIFFPVILLILFKLSRQFAMILLILLLALSFLFSEWLWREDLARSFYFSLNRFWELLAGSLVAFFLFIFGSKKNNALALLGLVSIIFSIFVYDEAIPFPSAYTLVPVLGTVLFIVYADKQTLAARLLSTKAFVGIGLISYSAYLWHQPILAFSKIYFQEKLSNELTFALCIFTFILAYFSWRFIEKPARIKEMLTRKAIFITFTIGTVFFTTFGLYGFITDGLQRHMLNFKYSAEKRNEFKAVFEATQYDMYNEMAITECKIWVRDPTFLNMPNIESCNKKYGKAIIVLGDSHAMNLFNIVSYSDLYPFVIGVSQGGCRPHNNKKECHYDAFEVFLEANYNVIDLVLYHQSGSYFIKDIYGRVDSGAAFNGEFLNYATNNIMKVKNYLRKISSEANIKVLWVGPFLEFRWRPQQQIFSNKIYKANPTSVTLFEGLEGKIYSAVSDEKGFSYERYSNLFFEPQVSFVKNCFVFRDKDHYSKCGEKIIAQRLTANFLNDYF